jgi:hypothetical protein
MTETVTVAAIVRTPDGEFYEERVVPAEVAEAIESGDEVVDVTAWPAVRFTRDEALEHLAWQEGAEREQLAQVLAARDQLEAEHPELRERRKKNDG